MTVVSNDERFGELICSRCQVVGIADGEGILRARSLEVGGFDVPPDYLESDIDAMHLNFFYGTVTAGRTLKIFRLMLEANLLVYTQDQAQLGIDADTGSAVLILRLPITDSLDGARLAELFEHYAEHGRYWRQNILDADDEMFDGLTSGAYFWLKA